MLLVGDKVSRWFIRKSSGCHIQPDQDLRKCHNNIVSKDNRLGSSKEIAQTQPREFYSMVIVNSPKLRLSLMQHHC
jgi:hypothetical protein